MNRISAVLLFVLWWGAVGCTPGEVETGGSPPTQPPSTPQAPPEPPPAPSPAPPVPSPPAPPSSKPADYIQWTCHLSKPRCQDRFEWAELLDDAYTVCGERDLGALLAEGRRYLKGGERELVDLTPEELGFVIARMASVNARGDRLIDRITTVRHRYFQVDAVAPWHRSQVRTDVARSMRSELEDETDIYTDIARQFPAVADCDAIACQVRKMNEGGN